MGRNQGPARKHHFVPAAYLGQFAKPKGRLGRLFVFDSKSRKSWTGTPETQARLMDPYTVEGDEPDRVERALGFAESELLPALQRIEKGTRSHADVAKVACFVALQSIRGPERLDATREFMEELANMTLSMVTHSKEAFDASTARVKTNDLPQGVRFSANSRSSSVSAAPSLPTLVMRGSPSPPSVDSSR